MRRWWQRRSLKLRLALWFTAVASGILLGLTPVVYALIEHRLHVEFDRQLRIDWGLVAAHLEKDGKGGLRWRAEEEPAGEGLEQAGLGFEVWSPERQLLLRHWPTPAAPIQAPLPGPGEGRAAFYTIDLAKGMPVRVMEEPARIGERAVILRVFRDESSLHRGLREILTGFALGVPLAAVLAALGGYLMAGRTLKPISALAEQARQITSESLSRRLHHPNPHDELGQLTAVFNQTLERLENSFDSLQRFTADASHELRTPLTALRAVGEVALRESGEAGAWRETVGSMLEEAQRLNDLLDALLTLARMESGKQPIHPEPIPAAGLLAEVRESLSVLAAEKQQTIDLDSGEGLVVDADRLLLRQALLNILHNAIRYAPARSRIAVKAGRRDGAAFIEVADEGSGIAREHHQKIFERFYRVDKSRSRVAGGSGLGLAIAQWSIAQQGGTIELDSEPGQGSRFRIVLPLGR